MLFFLTQSPIKKLRALTGKLLASLFDIDWEQIFIAVPQINLNPITIQFIPEEPKTTEEKIDT